MKDKIDEVKIQYKGWNEISINKYYEIADVFKSDMEELDMYLNLLAILCDTDIDKIYNLPYQRAQQMFKEIAWVNDFDIFKKKSKTISFDKLKINGETYKVDVDLKNFTVSQYIDFQTFWGANDFEKYYGNILAVFIIPEGHKYGDNYDIADLANKFRDNVSIVTANQVCFFFLNSLRISMQGTLIFLNWILKKAMRKQNKEKVAEIKKQIAQLEMAIMDGFPWLTT